MPELGKLHEHPKLTHPVCLRAAAEHRPLTKAELRRLLLDALRPAGAYLESFHGDSLGWTPDERSRAVRDALPLLERAYSVSSEWGNLVHTPRDALFHGPIDQGFVGDFLRVAVAALQGPQAEDCIPWLAGGVQSLYQHVLTLPVDEEGHA